MPTPMIKSFAKKSGKSVQDVEKIWDKVKASTVGTDHEEDYAYIAGAVKNALGLDENQSTEVMSFKEYYEMTSKGSNDESGSEVTEISEAK